MLIPEQGYAEKEGLLSSLDDDGENVEDRNVSHNTNFLAKSFLKSVAHIFL